MADLLVECPIHLDAVSINDILVFKCGHGFCEPCLEEHFAHRGQSSLSCPSCRKPVRRKEAFPLFLAPGQPSSGSQTQGSRPTTDAAHARLTRELQEAKAAHANCSGRIHGLQDRIDVLEQDSDHHHQTIQLLRDRYGSVKERLTGETVKSAHAKEEISRLREEVKKLLVENHKASRDRDQALKELQGEHERVKLLQGYNEQYKHKYNLEKKKRKAIEDASRPLPKEEESLMVVDANAPDVLHQDGPNFGWLDEACKVKGDQLAVSGDEDVEFEESEDELLFRDSDVKGKRREDRVPGPPLQFSSDWNLGLEVLGESSSSATRKRRHGSRQVGGGKVVKVKMAVGGPLAIDRHGRIKGAVALGSRQKLNSKN